MDFYYYNSRYKLFNIMLIIKLYILISKILNHLYVKNRDALRVLCDHEVGDGPKGLGASALKRNVRFRT